jgi:thiamine-phosphate pyrophosphorylase
VRSPSPDARLERARLYLVAGERLAAGRVADVLPELAAAGVDVLQLREKDMEVRDLLRVGAELAEACERAGIPFVLNDRPDVASVLGVGVHVGQDDLPVEHARRLVGGEVVGLSTHARSEIDAAHAAPVRPDYIAVGPLYATPTKPGRPAVGLELARYAATTAGLPWFAIGGIDESNLGAVLDAGARRIVVVRAVTKAADPVAAAASLRARLDEAPL